MVEESFEYVILIGDISTVPDWAFEAAGQEMRGMGQEAAYQPRLYLTTAQPVIAGLGDEDKPFICTMDSIGVKELAKDFVVGGTASESLYGACEAMFKPQPSNDHYK